MAGSRQEETRTRLSGKAIPFRPSIGAISTSSSLGSYLPSSCSDLDSSTSTIGDRSTLSAAGVWTSPSFPGTPKQASAYWSYSNEFHFTPPAIMQECQGLAGFPNSGNTEFKLGDFRSKLLKRAQDLAPQESSLKEFGTHSTNVRGGELWLTQALMSDSLGVTPPGTPRAHRALPSLDAHKGGSVRASDMAYHATSGLSAGDRQQAMYRCMQPLAPSEYGDSPRAEGGDIPAPLQHAATFTEGTPSERLSSKAEILPVPVKNTFIHFRHEGNGPMEPSFQWASAPALIMKEEFHTKYPVMEAAHIRGDCRACVYFTKKADGCRKGADCEYCHLCPVGSLQRKRKEKVKAIREQETKEILKQRFCHGYGVLARRRAERCT